MNVQDEDQDLGYLQRYGIVIVPAASESVGGWYVTLTQWDDDREAYVASSDGPMLADRREALQEAQRVLDWLATLDRDVDVMRLWEHLQQAVTENELGMESRSSLPYLR